MRSPTICIIRAMWWQGHAARMGTCKILTEGRGLNSSGSRQRPVSGCCGDGDEPWGFHKAGVISWLAARFSRTILFHAASYDRFAYQFETELGRERKDEGKQWRKSDPGSEGRVTTFTASRSHSPQEPATCLSNVYNLEGQESSCEKEDAFLEETWGSDGAQMVSMLTFWVVTPRGLAGRYRRPRRL
jgi:hypothetical protein